MKLFPVGILSLLILLLLGDGWQLRQRLKVSQSELNVANGKIVVMQSEVTACRGVIVEQNGKIEGFRVQAEQAQAKAAQAATTALNRPRKVLDGHGPVAMNVFFEALH